MPPPSLTPQQENLCERLNELHATYGREVKPSDMFRGAIFAAREECGSNLDWPAQAANSLREILYPVVDRRLRDGTDTNEEALKNFGSVYVDPNLLGDIGRMWKRLSDLAHHNSASGNENPAAFGIADFEKLLAHFERTMSETLTRQIDIHRDIDAIINAGPTHGDVEESDL